MIRTLTVLSGLVVICTWSASSASTILTTEGLGAVHIGMTVAQAERALGTKFDRELGDDQDCWITQQSGHSNPGVYYYVEYGHVFLIGIENQDEKGNTIANPDVVTSKGIRLGSPVEDLLAQYGKDLLVKKYFDHQPDYDMYLISNDKNRAIKILTDTISVSALFVGTFTTFQTDEPCPD